MEVNRVRPAGSPRSGRPVHSRGPLPLKGVFMKRLCCAVLAAMVLLLCLPVTGEGYPVLSGLSVSCGGTVKMLPEKFDPFTSTYLITVDSYVTSVSLVPYADWGSSIAVNGRYVSSGSASQALALGDTPLEVSVQVNRGGTVGEYTLFLQRRPSEKRTRVSAGFIQSIYQSGGKWYIAADLVTVNYRGSSYSDGNRSSYINDSSYLYKYPVSPHCVFYYSTNGFSKQCKDLYGFMSVYTGTSMYRIVYIEDEIAAVMPYTSAY